MNKLKSLVEEIRSFGGEATYCVADVEVFDQFKAIAFKLQHSSEPKSEDASNNFYQPVAEDDRVNGDYGNLVILSVSVSDWLEKNPVLQWGAIAGAAALALLAVQVLKEPG
ncbi:hypothetical protein ACEYW6_24440 [Nostoc sp. UIC 10607]|uniref:hypothetical protein n=1 Tax=Nostoc sp. UIC 10607 TaxID=3045935 RepID=UPI0039A06C84